MGLPSQERPSEDQGGHPQVRGGLPQVSGSLPMVAVLLYVVH